MNKKFRCGRIVLTTAGTIKKLDLEKGGGSRFCKWYYKYMNFNDVRRNLIKIFNLDDTEHEISLYDFQLRPLDLDQYKTLWHYINNNGLNCNGTVIYLCTREEVDDSHPPKKVIMKNKKKQSTLKKKRSTQAETNSSPTSIEYKQVIKNEPDSDQQQIHPSLYEYSFKTASNHLVKTIRKIMNENNFDEILIELFERFCVMHGFVCSTIEPLQQNQYYQSINQSQHLNTIYDICYSIKLLLNRVKDKLEQIQQFTALNDLFIEYYKNFKILRDQYSEHIKDKTVDRTSSSSNIFLTRTHIDTNAKTPNKETSALFQPLLNSAADENDKPKNSKRSSTSLSITRQEQSENNQLRRSKKIKLEKLHDDRNVPIDTAIYSSSDIQQKHEPTK